MNIKNLSNYTIGLVAEVNKMSSKFTKTMVGLGLASLIASSTLQAQIVKTPSSQKEEYQMADQILVNTPDSAGIVGVDRVVYNVTDSSLRAGTPFREDAYIFIKSVRNVDPSKLSLTDAYNSGLVVLNYKDTASKANQQNITSQQIPSSSQQSKTRQLNGVSKQQSNKDLSTYSSTQKSESSKSSSLESSLEVGDYAKMPLYSSYWTLGKVSAVTSWEGGDFSPKDTSIYKQKYAERFRRTKVECFPKDTLFENEDDYFVSHVLYGANIQESIPKDQAFKYLSDDEIRSALDQENASPNTSRDLSKGKISVDDVALIFALHKYVAGQKSNFSLGVEYAHHSRRSIFSLGALINLTHQDRIDDVLLDHTTSQYGYMSDQETKKVNVNDYYTTRTTTTRPVLDLNMAFGFGSEKIVPYIGAGVSFSSIKVDSLSKQVHNLYEVNIRTNSINSLESSTTIRDLGPKDDEGKVSLAGFSAQAGCYFKNSRVGVSLYGSHIGTKSAMYGMQLKFYLGKKF